MNLKHQHNTPYMDPTAEKARRKWMRCRCKSCCDIVYRPQDFQKQCHKYKVLDRTCSFVLTRGVRESLAQAGVRL